MTENMKTNENAAGETIQFSIEKTKHITFKKSADTPPEAIDTAEEEEELLKTQSVPTEFEDIFSDDGIEEFGNAAAEGVVGIEEVFEQRADMINRDFHNETGEESEAEPQNPKLKRAAIIIGIISGAIILAAAAVALVIIL